MKTEAILIILALLGIVAAATLMAVADDMIDRARGPQPVDVSAP